MQLQLLAKWEGTSPVRALCPYYPALESGEGRERTALSDRDPVFPKPTSGSQSRLLSLDCASHDAPGWAAAVKRFAGCDASTGRAPLREPRAPPPPVRRHCRSRAALPPSPAPSTPGIRVPSGGRGGGGGDLLMPGRGGRGRPGGSGGGGTGHRKRGHGAQGVGEGRPGRARGPPLPSRRSQVWAPVRQALQAESAQMSQPCREGLARSPASSFALRESPAQPSAPSLRGWLSRALPSGRPLWCWVGDPLSGVTRKGFPFLPPLAFRGLWCFKALRLDKTPLLGARGGQGEGLALPRCLFPRKGSEAKDLASGVFLANFYFVEYLSISEKHIP